MKKVFLWHLHLMLVLTILFPAGTIAAACFGYRFQLFSVPGFAAVIAVISVCTVVLDCWLGVQLESKILSVLLAVIVPASLINALFLIFACSRIEVVAYGFLSAVCCCFLSIRHGKPAELKLAILVLSALMILPISFLSFLFFLFSDLAQNTVVQTISSPSGIYYAEVIDSDQGAMGGDTLVDVYHTRSSLNLFLFTIEKKPKCVYVGNWGEYENMQIYWQDDSCLVINSAEYRID